jgi:hypothetical protein
MQAFMERVMALEAEMDTGGTFVFGGALDGPDAASVMHPGGNDVAKGPFAGSKAHIAGFSIINADNLDEAQAWAGKVADATNHPIEVRPFRATGRVADHMPGA